MPLSSRALRSLAPSLVVGALLVSLPSRAREGDPFEDGDVVDEIALSRVAEEAGDTALAGRLRDPSGRQAALIALRASPHARAPESLVPLLSALACGRDPVLAPEAAAALFRMIGRLYPAQLSSREALSSDLRAAHESLSCSEKAPLPRADIVQTLLHVRAALDSLLP